MTLLLKGDAKAMESNDVLNNLKKLCPKIIHKRDQRISTL
jgi:hypothetical protein